MSDQYESVSVRRRAWRSFNYDDFNSNLCQSALFCSPGRSRPRNLPVLSICGSAIDSADVVRDLGVWLDSELTKGSHVISHRAPVRWERQWPAYSPGQKFRAHLRMYLN